MTKAMVLYKDEDGILKGIASIRKMGETLKLTIHKAGVSVLSLWVNGKIDQNKAAELLTLTQSAAGYHAHAFAEWIAAKTDMHWADKTETWYAHKDTVITPGQFLSAKAEAFWEISPPKKPNPLSLAKELMKVLIKAQKHQEKPSEGDDVPADLVKRLAGVMAQWEMEQAKAKAELPAA